MIFIIYCYYSYNIILKKVLKTAIETNKETGNKLKMIAGTGAVSTHETIQLTNAAAKMVIILIMNN